MSMIGLVIAMLIMGTLAVSLVPMMLSKYNQSTTVTDRKALEAARTAIIGYMFSAGKLPCPVTDANGSACTANGVAGMLPPASAVPALGVNNYGVFGKENPFRMDVNDALRNVATGNVKSFCAKAQSQMTTPGNGPSVCQDAACASSAPAAFVLYSTGSDHVANLKNASTNRIYESDNRGIDNTAGASYYDDQVVSYSLSSLVAACAKEVAGAKLPVCNLNATPSTVVSGVATTVTLTASCSNMATTPVYNWSNPPGWPSTIASSGISVNTTANQTYTVSGTNELGTGASASATVAVRITIFTENFNAITGAIFNGGQYQSGLPVAYGGNLAGWTKAGTNPVHLVEPNSLASNFAVMIYSDNVITLNSAIVGSNTTGANYTVDFSASPAVYQAGSQATLAGDALLIEVLRANSTVLASYTYQPGAWAGNIALTAASFTYVGDGSGDVTLRISSASNTGRFAGAIDNLTVSH